MSQLDVPAIGRRVAAYRRRNHWSAQHLADNTDGAVSRATIANLESGRRASIGVGQFLALSLALRVPPFALLVDLEQPFNPSGVAFTGTAPAPLAPGTPTIAFARWLNAETSTTTTDAGRYVADVLALVIQYSDLIDSDESAAARERLNVQAQSRRTDIDADRGRLRQRLKALGVQLPA